MYFTTLKLVLFQGMPQQWAILLQNSQISKLEQQQNPQAVLDALNYYTQGELNTHQKWLQPSSFDSLGRKSFPLLSLFLLLLNRVISPRNVEAETKLSTLSFPLVHKPGQRRSDARNLVDD